jgi:hypothetical protein
MEFVPRLVIGEINLSFKKKVLVASFCGILEFGKERKFGDKK